MRKIAAMAEAYDVAVAPHCPLGPLALGACLQIAACTPNHAIQEISLGIHYNTGGHDLLNFCTNKEALTPVDGYLPVPEGPGLGVDIDEAAVREADKDRHRWRNPIFRTDGRQLRRVVSRISPGDIQWHLKRSNGSRQDLQRHCALHGVEPKRLTSSVSVEPHCGQVAALLTARAGRCRRRASRSRPRSVIQSVVQGGNSSRSMCDIVETRPRRALRGSICSMATVAGQPV